MGFTYPVVFASSPDNRTVNFHKLAGCNLSKKAKKKAARAGQLLRAKPIMRLCVPGTGSAAPQSHARF